MNTNIDHWLARPELTELEVAKGCELARRYGVASATVRPCDIDVAVRILTGSGVAPGSVCGYPYGDQNTGTKLYEARDLLRRGAKEIDVAINISKLLSRQFQHIETELLQMSEACHKEGAKLKVIIDSPFLTDEMKIIACRIASRTEADFVSTGMADVALMRKNLPDDVGVKVAGGIETIEQALAALELGCGRFATTETGLILDEWKTRQVANA